LDKVPKRDSSECIIPRLIAYVVDDDDDDDDDAKAKQFRYTPWWRLGGGRGGIARTHS
jgi:hypothetical protein